MPRQPDIPPTVKVHQGIHARTVKTHPAYGMASFSRVSGGSGDLFGSELQHNHFIRFTLGPGESVWRLSETVYHGHLSPRHVEIDFSAAQFAELITSMNVGMGVPCTIRTLNNEPLPGIVDTDNLHEQIKDDIATKTSGIVDTARELEKQLAAMLADSKVPKAKQEALRALAATITRELGANLPFVLDQYQEAAEKVKAKVAAEVDAMVTSMVQRAGIAALKGEVQPQIDTPRDSS